MEPRSKAKHNLTTSHSCLNWLLGTVSTNSRHALTQLVTNECVLIDYTPQKLVRNAWGIVYVLHTNKNLKSEILFYIIIPGHTAPLTR